MEEKKDIYILGIESSCDDTSAAVLKNGVLLSNVTASQEVHRAYGGVVPELASRAHQQNVVPVVDQAIARAGITKEDLSAVAFTRGPGLMGSLLVGVSFAKGFARSLNIPMIDVNHLQGHVMAHFIKESDDDQSAPPFPFICLLVSGGNSQIVKVNAYNDMEVLGQTIDDADEIMAENYPPGGRIPSVREYAALLQVNTNTAIKGYELLAREGIIFNKRGMGYFVAEDARHHIAQRRQEEFMETTLPELFRQMRLLNISIDEVAQKWEESKRE